MKPTAFAGRRQRGYVLVLVLGALALVAFVAGRFAARMDGLRSQAISLSGYAEARVAAESALQAGLYWVSTRPGGPGGYGVSYQPGIRSDGRPYALPGGALLRVQDQRGLFSLNIERREGLLRVLAGLGVSVTEADGLVDVLLDYLDTDNLKRLNGAEADEYRALGLPPPRNDWMLSTGELWRLPRWRDKPELIEALQAVSSTGKDGLLNPNDMPMALVRLLLPSAKPEQLALFETLRRDQPFGGAGAVASATGLQFVGEEFWFYTGDRVRLSVWAPGLPQATQYNLALVPDGAEAPWKITDTQPENKGTPSHGSSERPTPFPLALGAQRPR